MHMSPTFFKKTKNKSQKQGKIEFTFRTFNLSFFAIFCLVLIWLTYHTIRNTTHEISRDYAELYSIKTTGALNAYLNREIALITKAATSRKIMDWFTHEENIEHKDNAYKEMRSFLNILSNKVIYFGIDKSGHEFNFELDTKIDNFTHAAILSEEGKDDGWYFETKASNFNYMLNVDVDKIKQRRLVWLNHKVFSPDHTKVVGIIATGLYIEQVLENAFDEYDQSNIRGLVIDRNGIIQMDSIQNAQHKLFDDSTLNVKDAIPIPAFVEEVTKHIENIKGHFTTSHFPIVIELPQNNKYSFVSISPIANTDWSVITFFNASSLFSIANLQSLLWIIIGSLMLYMLCSTLISRKLIFAPLSKMMNSLAETTPRGDGSIYGINRNDEFGQLARTINELRAKLDGYNAELTEAMTKAKTASKAKSSFLANMSHEMRTPMNAIIGMSKIAKDSSSQEKIKECIGKIEIASVHLLGVINDVLDMSKIEAGKFNIVPSTFNFMHLLNRIEAVIINRMQEKGQTFIAEISPDIPQYIISDEQRLAQVLTNLLSNAEKFTPTDGTIYLGVKVLHIDNLDCTLEFYVRDTGIGIGLEQQKKLFIPFQQANAHISRSFGGTGLGLAFCKSVVELFGGEIKLDSEENKGTTITFSIKCTLPNADLQTLAEADASLIPHSTINSDFSNKRILLAEDIEINREILIAILEETKVQIDIAINGEQAFELFCKNPEIYDLIFMDINMPKMDGYEATQRIRAFDTKNAKTIPIIAMTANTFREDVEHCLEVGMNDHIGKPLDFNELHIKLKKFL